MVERVSELIELNKNNIKVLMKGIKSLEVDRQQIVNDANERIKRINETISDSVRKISACQGAVAALEELNKVTPVESSREAKGEKGNGGIS